MTGRLMLGCFLILFGSIPGGFAQRRPDPRQLYERIIVIAPMVGAGTAEDPRRPLHVPVLGTKAAPSANGIVGFTYEMSDDGKFAVVELVARDRRAFAAILTERRPDVKVFERGKARREEVEAEIRGYIRNFDFSRFGVRAQ